MITNLGAARFQMAYSLGFHMIFASLGVGMPLLMLIAEGRWMKTRQEHFLRLAKTWAKATSILFAIGAVSGTGLSFELGLLWPHFMGFAGSTIGPAFTLEGYAFFMEAIFLGLYLYGWDRLSPLGHWLSGLVVAISGAASSVLVMASNAWMQNPVGVEMLKTNPEGMNVASVLFRNPAWPVMTIHSTLSAYAATAFAVAGVYAWSALKGRVDDMRRSALSIAMTVGIIAAIAMPLTGHQSAVDIATRQPSKLAAAESLYETQAGAPLLIGGLPNPAQREVRFAIRIPKGLSILAFFNPNAVVAGLDQIPREDWPNIVVTHISFQVMVAAGFAMLGAAMLYWWMARKRRDPMAHKGLLRILVAASPLGFIALEAGWMVTEVGRQPWIIYKVMRTADAVTPATGLLTSLWGFIALYAFLGIVLVWLLSRLRHA